MADGSGNPNPGQPDGPVWPEMIREAQAHLPFAIKDPILQWQWLADFINRAVANPGGPWCDCCGPEATRGY